MKKDIALICGLFLVIIVLLVFGQGFTSSSFVNKKNTDKQTSPAAKLEDQIQIKIKDFEITAAVADSPDEHKKGLSGREEIPLDWGMLFVFSESKPHIIWMKDMEFAIDVVWIGADKKIVDIAENVPPEPHKKDNQLTRYTPRNSAKYILEYNAGLSSLNNIQIGDTVEF